MRESRHTCLTVSKDVEAWETLEERPTGSREKVTVAQPGTHELAIFKRPKDGREHQVWSELVGSFVAGDMLGWPVQATGFGMRRGEPGNLLAYFFDPDGGERLTEGWLLCRDVKPGFDDEKGTDHSLALLDGIAESVLEPRYGVARGDFLDYWARAIAFDTLISNTDRHAENWGIIESAKGNRMAPLYDNATSLGCSLDAKALRRDFDGGAVDPARVARFAARGHHHLRIEGTARKGATFAAVCAAFLTAHPGWRWAFEAVADLDLSPAADLLGTLAEGGFPAEGRDHAAFRAAHMGAILAAGRERVRQALTGMPC